MILVHWHNKLRQTQIPVTTDIELVKQDSFFSSTDTSFSISGIQSGDFVLIFRTDDSGQATWSDVFQGGTSILPNDALSSGVGPDSVLGYYVATSSLLIVETTTSGGEDQGAYEMVSYAVFRNVNSTTPIDVTPTYVADSAGNIAPNPPSITTVTDGCMIIVLVSIDDSDITSATFDSSYTLLTKLYGGTGDPCHYLIYKTQSTAGSENPAQFTNYPTSIPSNDDHHTVTLALRPA